MDLNDFYKAEELNPLTRIRNKNKNKIDTDFDTAIISGADIRGNSTARLVTSGILSDIWRIEEQNISSRFDPYMHADLDIGDSPNVTFSGTLSRENNTLRLEIDLSRYDSVDLVVNVDPNCSIIEDRIIYPTFEPLIAMNIEQTEPEGVIASPFHDRIGRTFRISKNGENDRDEVEIIRR